jgi:uncharacterized membrane protein
MCKKILIFGIIFFLIFLIFSPSTLSQEFIENEKIVSSSFRTIFAASPLITITYEELEEPIIPNTKTIRIPLKISYELTGRYATRQLRKLRNEVVTIELSITDQEEGVDANIENSLFDIKIGSNDIFTTNLIVTVNENIQANTVGTVKIIAKSEEISGLFFTLVEKGEQTVEVGFVIGYWPVISSSLPEGSNFEIPPLRNTKIPIRILNLGNGPTYVAIEIIDIPKNWNITFPSSLQLPSAVSKENYEKEINIDVKPPKDFSRNTINISITPHLLGDPTNKGQTEIITFNFKNDGSYKEGTPIFLIILIVIIIMIILGLLLIIRKYYTK